LVATFDLAGGRSQRRSCRARLLRSRVQEQGHGSGARCDRYWSRARDRPRHRPASRGARLEVGAVDLPKAGLTRAFPPRRRNVLAVEADVSDEPATRMAVESVVDRFGRLDALVSNAGIMVRKPLRQLTVAECGPPTSPPWPPISSTPSARASSRREFLCGWRDDPQDDL
jgi:NAD(P)-dependent dehydrogenase (short-subunit alcohol dehydrogenase family)